jgi:hypothetical protein
VFPSRWKFAGGVVLLAAVAVVAVVVAQPTSPREKAAKERAALAEARRKAAQKAYDQLFEGYRRGAASMPSPETVYLWSRRCLDADLDVSDKAVDQTAAYQAHLDRMKGIETQMREAATRTGAGSTLIPALEFYRAEAEYWLARAVSEKP